MGRDDRRAKSVRTELWSWVKALVISVPIVVALWFVLDQLPSPWVKTVFPVLALAPFLVIGLLSKANVWALVVWLAPLVALEVMFVAGARGSVLVVGSVLAFGWVVGIMFWESFQTAVFRALAGAFQLFVMAGLSRQKRKAYRELRMASLWTDEQMGDARQLDDTARTVRAFREPGRQISALRPPDERWAQVFEAAAASFLRGADMLESGQPVDYAALNQLVQRRQELIHQLLSDESIPYRVLTFVPGSLFRR
jgi:hypothetical protein